MREHGVQLILVKVTGGEWRDIGSDDKRQDDDLAEGLRRLTSRGAGFKSRPNKHVSYLVRSDENRDRSERHLEPVLSIWLYSLRG